MQYVYKHSINGNLLQESNLTARQPRKVPTWQLK